MFRAEEVSLHRSQDRSSCNHKSKFFQHKKSMLATLTLLDVYLSYIVYFSKDYVKVECCRMPRNLINNVWT